MYIQSFRKFFAPTPAQRELVLNEGYALIEGKIVCAPAQTAEEAYALLLRLEREEVDFERHLLGEIAQEILGDPREAWVLETGWYSQFRNQAELPDFEQLRESYNVLRRIVRLQKKGRVSTKLCAEYLHESGCRSVEDIEAFTRLEPYTWGDSPERTLAIAKVKELKKLPAWAQAEIVWNEGLDLARPGQARQLLAAAKSWKLNPLFRYWKREAVRIGQLPIKQRLIAAAVVNRLAVDYEIRFRETWLSGGESRWKTERELRNVFWRRFNAACRGGLGAVAKDIPTRGDNLLRVAFTLHGRSVSPDVVRELAKASSKPDQLVGLKVGQWPAIRKALRGGSEDWVLRAALGLLATFGKQWKTWLSSQEKLGITSHDATYWLPKGSPASLQGLDGFLLKHKRSDLTLLGVVASNWKHLTEEERKLSLSQILEICRNRSYADQTNPEFAAEAAKWGVASDEYAQLERIYLSAQDVPEPFGSQQRWEAGSYVGRFLPRSDVRSGFFGHYTICCQHYTGVGSECAIASVCAPHSQLFVVEEEGKIVAGSWVWETQYGDKKGACFDNIEARKLNSEQQSCVAKIYKDAAKWLCRNSYHKVTAGSGQSDISLKGFEKIEPLPLPAAYGNGYSDAKKKQVLLASS